MVNWSLSVKRFVLVIFVIGLLGFLGLINASIEADLTKFLPEDIPVISDATEVFQNHPLQDRVLIDIGTEKKVPDVLVQAGSILEQELEQSPLFKAVGFKKLKEKLPELTPYIVEHLPVLFTKNELENKVRPLLTAPRVKQRLKQVKQDLYSLQNLGSSGFLSKDPLGLKDLIMSKMEVLAPTEEISIYKNELLSKDRRHLLLTVSPVGAGTDSRFARKLEQFFKKQEQKLCSEFGPQGYKVELSTLGTYKSALDNERIIRKDVTFALVLTTLGIALLLVLAFPRPLIGLFAFMPALAGTVLAFLVLSVLQEDVSLLVIGFGGAIISITVDHGIAFLLFLDSEQKSFGRQASREVWSIGLITALTTIGAFSALCLTRFPLFAQLGLFSALGIAFSFLFVHLVFPGLFPVLAPSSSKRILPVQALVLKISQYGKKGFWPALVLLVVLSFWAKPEFNVDLGAMNTVSSSTRQAEELVQEVWGGGFLKEVHLLSRGEDLQDLQTTWDRLRPLLEQDMREGEIGSAFVPSMLFPGPGLRQDNYQAWKDFWTRARIGEFKKNLQAAAAKYGFKYQAFSPFLKMLKDEYTLDPNVDKLREFSEMLGISSSHSGPGYVQFSNIVPGKEFEARQFYQKYSSEHTKVFDPNLFSQALGKYLHSEFIDLLIIAGFSVLILLVLFFLDLKLVFLSLTPILFSLVCTLGTLNLLGRAIDIPSLMLSIVILGMGIDYSLFTVRAYQRYALLRHENFYLVQSAIFMAGLSSMIGFGVLVFSQHSVLESVGLTSFLGIGYALAGAFILLPYLLERLVFRQDLNRLPAQDWKKNVLKRYKHLEAFPRMFARFKLRLDPMFTELKGYLDPDRTRQVLDIGCGLAVPACSILEWFPQAKVFGVEPDPERGRVASLVMGPRGVVAPGTAPKLPWQSLCFDTVLMLDCLHYLPDRHVVETLNRCKQVLEEKGILIARLVVPPDKKGSWVWKMELFRQRVFKIKLYYRSGNDFEELLKEAGFNLVQVQNSGGNPESVWILARK